MDAASQCGQQREPPGVGTDERSITGRTHREPPTVSRSHESRVLRVRSHQRRTRPCQTQSPRFAVPRLHSTRLAQCLHRRCLPSSCHTLCCLHEFLGNRRRPAIYGAVFTHKVMATVTATIGPYNSYGSPRIAVTRRTCLPVTRMFVNPIVRKSATISLRGAALPVSITKRPPGRRMRADSLSAPLLLLVKAGNGTHSKYTVRN